MRKTLCNMRRAVLVALVSIVPAFMLSGCIRYLATPVTAKEPEVTYASEDEISIGVWGWSRPDAIASQHCRKFDKEAVFLATVRADEYDDTRIVYYRCQWPNYCSTLAPRDPDGHLADLRRPGFDFDQ